MSKDMNSDEFWSGVYNLVSDLDRTKSFSVVRDSVFEFVVADMYYQHLSDKTNLELPGIAQSIDNKMYFLGLENIEGMVEYRIGMIELCIHVENHPGHLFEDVMAETLSDIKENGYKLFDVSSVSVGGKMVSLEQDFVSGWIDIMLSPNASLASQFVSHLVLDPSDVSFAIKNNIDFDVLKGVIG